MNTKDMLMIGAAAVGVYLLLRQNDSMLGWWQSLTGIRPGTQQSAMLMQQEGEFWKSSSVTGGREQPVGWYVPETWQVSV